MQHIQIAQTAGVTLDDLDCLLRGQVNANVANRLRVTMADVEGFISGSPSISMAQRLGVGTIAAASELATSMGSQGATGVVLGLLLSDQNSSD